MKTFDLILALAVGGLAGVLSSNHFWEQQAQEAVAAQVLAYQFAECDRFNVSAARDGAILVEIRPENFQVPVAHGEL